MLGSVWEKLGLKIHPVVFPASAGTILVFLILGVVATDWMTQTFTLVQTFIIERFGWFYVLSVSIFLFFTLYLMMSRYGDLRLGADNEKPKYSYGAWFSMLFSAGMGIGLLFYSVAEPILHFTDPQVGEPRTVEAAKRAMHLTFHHWGLHAWAVYIVVALSLCYFSYRKGLPLAIRSTLFPVLGNRIYGFWGDLVEILAVFGTLFGLATSLGLGVMQINTGLDYLGLMSVSLTNQLALIAGITLMATASVVSGLDKGIKILSVTNIVLGLILLFFVFFTGPTVFLLSSFVQSLGTYSQHLLEMSFRTDAFIGPDWQGNWTMFYWGWWISWSPFVGMFIARISRGRTVRELILGVMMVPTLLTFFWLVVFGNTALHFELFGGGGVAEMVAESVPKALYALLEKLPFHGFTFVLTTIVITGYFVTSSDSGSFVIDMLTSGGELDPPVAQRIFWALAEGAVAAVLLVNNGLKALQTAAIATALPFCLVMLVICFCLLRGMGLELEYFDDRADRVQESESD